MRKTKNGKIVKKDKAKPKAAKAPKPTVEQLSDQQRQALLFSHARKLKPLLAVETEAKAAVTKAFELAKKEGVLKKEIKLKLSLETEEGIDAAKAELERTNRVARWMGVGKQLELFGGKETVAERHYEDGRRAALDDRPASPPAHLAQKDADVWLSGHAAGRTSLNTERASTGFKPLSEVVSDLIPDPPPMPANGNAEHVAH